MADAIVISEEDKQEFWPSGAVRIESILDETWLRLLRDTADEEIRNAGPGGHFADPGRATFFASIRPWRWRDAFRRFVFESPAASIASQLLGSPSVQLFSDQLFVKEPGAVERTPWQQDLPFWPLRGTGVLSVWVALDHVDLASGGLQYFRGRHDLDPRTRGLRRAPPQVRARRRRQPVAGPSAARLLDSLVRRRRGLRGVARPGAAGGVPGPGRRRPSPVPGLSARIN
jgi:Phytanoyl-CoA dioxygenase (PhyH)